MADGYVLSEKDYQLFREMVRAFRSRLQGQRGRPKAENATDDSEIHVVKLEEGDYIPARSGETPGVKQDCPIYRLDETFTEDETADNGATATATLTPIELADDDPYAKRVYNIHDRGIPACGYHIVEKLKGGGWTVQPYEMTPYALVDCKRVRSNVYVLNDLAAHVGEVVKWDGTCWEISCGGNFDTSAANYAFLPLTDFSTDCEDCRSCWELRPCTGTAAYRYTNTNLSAHLLKVVRPVDDGICYTVYRATNCSGATPIGSYDYYETCTPCAECYTLTPCWGGGAAIKVKNDLATLVEVASGDLVVSGGYVFEVNGQCYSATAFGSSCSGATSEEITEYYVGCSSCGCYKLTPCSGTASPIYAREADILGSPVSLRELVDGLPDADPPVEPTPYVRLDDGTTWSIERSTECTSTQAVTILETYTSCEDALVYTITECTGTAATAKTYTDLAGLGLAVGEIFKKTDGTCWTITNNSATYSGSVSVDVDLDANNPYPSCAACNGTIKYKLTFSGCIHDDCEDAETPTAIVTYTDLHAIVGKYVKYKGACALISTTSDTITDDDIGEDSVKDVFEDCATCKVAETTWKESVLVDFRADASTRKLQMKRATIKVTGESRCTDNWEDINTGTACP